MTTKRLFILFGCAVLLMAATRGTIDWNQLKSGARHGTGAFGQASDGTGTSGNCAKFDANGNITDSGGTCVTGGGSGTSNISLLSESKPIGTKHGYTLKQQSVAAGATIDILPTVSGSGYVDYLWLAGGSNLYNNEVKVFVDGEVTPSIDMGYVYLFGAPYSPLACCNVPYLGKWSGFNGGGYLRVPIPFTTSIHITLTNTDAATQNFWSETYYQTGVTITTLPYTQKLHIVAASATGVAANATATFLNVSPGKRGRLAGIEWLYDAAFGSVTPATAALEGAFTITVDGSTAITSSGAEDFFGMSGYFIGFNPPTVQDDQGLLLKANNTWSAFRFFQHDPLVFNTSLSITWACGNTTFVSFTGTCATLATVYYYTEL